MVGWWCLNCLEFIGVAYAEEDEVLDEEADVAAEDDVVEEEADVESDEPVCLLCFVSGMPFFCWRLFHPSAVLVVLSYTVRELSVAMHKLDYSLLM